jgi:hypothetical protein
VTFVAVALYALSLGLPESPPAAASIFLDAIEAGDAAAAREAIAAEARIDDTRTGEVLASSVEALADYIGGCERTDIAWRVIEDRPGEGDVEVAWNCPSRDRAQLLVRADEERVLQVRFGPPGPAARTR